MIGLKLIEEESFHGEIIETPEEFVDDLCERLNIAYSTMMEEDDKMNQLAFITTFLIAFKGRLNRVCENI
ncbi:unnamed protein product [marine sediment metagenome]|uniref:Uncharacterized protein n=2 Tax=marine sediment metagenome TaxID=412755 RepID=X1H7K0_9ZZZZ